MLSILIAIYACLFVGMMIVITHCALVPEGEDNLFKKMLNDTEYKVLKGLFYIAAVAMCIPPLWGAWLAFKQGDPSVYIFAFIYLCLAILFIKEKITEAKTAKP